MHELVKRVSFRDREEQAAAREARAPSKPYPESRDGSPTSQLGSGDVPQVRVQPEIMGYILQNPAQPHQQGRGDVCGKKGEEGGWTETYLWLKIFAHFSGQLVLV